MRWSLAAVLSLVCLSATAQTAPSFDCRKAASSAEKRICGDRTLAALDARIARAYATKLKQLAPETAKAFRRTQQWFLMIRDARLEMGGSLTQQALATPRETLQGRLDAIGAVAARIPADFTGTWANNSGHWQILRRPDGRYDVRAATVEQINARWICDIQTVARREGTALLIEERPGYRLVRRQGVLQVEHTGNIEADDPNCGMNGHLDGEFIFTTQAPRNTP